MKPSTHPTFQAIVLKEISSNDSLLNENLKLQLKVHSCECLQSSALAILLLIDVLPTLEQKRAMTMPLKAVYRMDFDLSVNQGMSQVWGYLAFSRRLTMLFILCPYIYIYVCVCV